MAKKPPQQPQAAPPPAFEAVLPPPRPKGGRPPSLVPDARTLQIVRGLGSIRATTKESAAVLGVSEPTFITFKKTHEEVAEAYEHGAEIGKVSQRRDLIQLARRNGNVAIFLAMNQLGMKDLRARWSALGLGAQGGKGGGAAGDRRVIKIVGGLPDDDLGPPPGATPPAAGGDGRAPEGLAEPEGAPAEGAGGEAVATPDAAPSAGPDAGPGPAGEDEPL